jgi:outer membrane protein insertion porin family
MRPLRALPQALVLLASVFALITLTTRPLIAQYSVEKLVFTGAAPYTDAELAATTGLAPGLLLAHDSLANAAQHLLDTGLFDDAQVVPSGAGKTRTITFTLKPIPLDKLLPVSLENFVWLTPEELTSAIHTHVPLYRGVASDAGNLADLIQAALTSILATKGVTATVTHGFIEPSSAHPVRVIAFRVEKPSTPVATINLTIKSSSPEAVAAAKVALPRRLTYNEGLAGFTIQDFLLTPARNAGYVTAKVDSLQREFTDTPSVHGITVTAAISPGAPYKISTLTWTPTPVYSAADFARDNKLIPGDLAVASTLNKTIGLIVFAYRSHGYLDAYILPTPTLDDTAHTVAYTLQAVAGEVYHLKSVTPTGLSGAARADFDRGWQMKPGDVYNENYIANFLHNNTALQALNGYSAGFQASADPLTHQVDLTLTFIKTSPTP